MSDLAAEHGFVDLHGHWLPAVDDGPRDLEESLAMLRRAHAGGTRKIVATPHVLRAPWNLDAATARRVFDGWRQDLADRAADPGHAFLADLELYLGGEHLLSPELIDAAQAGEVLPLGEKGPLLVELSPLLPAPAAVAGLVKLTRLGHRLLLAHVERYAELIAKRHYRHTLADLGCRFQVNAGSLLGGDRPKNRLAHQLLRGGWGTAVASDTHAPHRRPPDLAPVAEHLARRYGTAATRYWLIDAPTALLAGDDPGPPPRDGWWRRWRP